LWYWCLITYAVDAPASQANAVGTGLIGLGPGFGSQVHAALNTSQGVTPLDNIFLQNTSTPNYITILLQRDDDPGDVFPGELTIGELVPGYENVTNQPKLPVTQVSISDRGDQHWQLLLDDNGLIGPDGKPIDFDTGVKQTSNKGQLTAVLDSGFSLPQVPKYVHYPTHFPLSSRSLSDLWRMRFMATHRMQILSRALT
jgi:hypothetical protein